MIPTVGERNSDKNPLNIVRTGLSSADDISSKRIHARVITPSDPDQRGAQLSVFFGVDIAKVFKELTKRGVVVSGRS